MTESDLTEIAAFGYERARDELVNVVKMLEQGGLDLDDSLSLWERGKPLPTAARNTSPVRVNASKTPSPTAPRRTDRPGAKTVP